MASCSGARPALARPVLVALGLRPDGKKEVIDFRLATAESAAHDFEADTRLQRPLSTLREHRYRCPRKTRFRLAGCAFTGRGSNPLGHDERFPATSFPLSRAYPDASWAHCRRKLF